MKENIIYFIYGSNIFLMSFFTWLIIKKIEGLKQ